MRVTILSFLVTLIIIYLAVTHLDWEMLGTVATQVDPVFIFWAFVTWIFILLTKSWKWQTVVSSVGGIISLLESAKILLIGLFIGVITPGRVGDFVRVFYIKKKVGIGKGILAVLVDRILDVFLLLVFALVGVLFLFSSKGLEVVSFSLLGAGVVGFLFVVMVLLNRRIARKGWSLIQRFIPLSLRDMLKKYGTEFYDSVPLLRQNKMVIGWSLVIGVGAWLFTVTMGYFLLLAAHIPVGWEAALIVIPVISLIEIIPFGVAGVGTRELAAIAVLSVYSIPPESAIVFSVLYFVVGYFPSLVLGILLFNREPVHFRGGVQQMMDSLTPKQDKE